jgi:hypothetical protein
MHRMRNKTVLILVLMFSFGLYCCGGTGSVPPSAARAAEHPRDAAKAVSKPDISGPGLSRGMEAVLFAVTFAANPAWSIPQVLMHNPSALLQRTLADYESLLLPVPGYLCLLLLLAIMRRSLPGNSRRR